MDALAQLKAAGWRQVRPHEFPESPLRLYLGVALRDGEGCQFVVDAMWMPLPEGHEGLLELARQVALERYGREVQAA